MQKRINLVSKQNFFRCSCIRIPNAVGVEEYVSPTSFKDMNASIYLFEQGRITYKPIFSRRILLLACISIPKPTEYGDDSGRFHSPLSTQHTYRDGRTKKTPYRAGLWGVFLKTRLKIILPQVGRADSPHSPEREIPPPAGASCEASFLF